MLPSFTLAPLLQAEPLVQIHTVSAVVALLLGPVSLYGRKGRVHKCLGYVWFVAMAVVALSSFGIFNFRLIGPFSPIHLLSVVTLIALARSLTYARSGRIAAHKRVMMALYWYGLVMAGLFNFLPGRLVNQMALAQMADLGIYVIAVGLAAMVLRGVIGRRTGQGAETADVLR